MSYTCVCGGVVMTGKGQTVEALTQIHEESCPSPLVRKKKS